MYKRKTTNLYVVQMFTEIGWEDVTQSDKRKDARTDLKAYRDNDPRYSYRLVTKREKIDDCNIK